MTTTPPTPQPVGRHRYRIQRRLGNGAFGEVLLALDTVTGDEVAIKRIFQRPPERGVVSSAAAARDADAAADDEPAPARPPFPLPADLPPPVQREVEALLHIPEHPNVVRLRDVYVGGGGWGSSAGGGGGGGGGGSSRGPASPAAAACSSPAGRDSAAAAAACRGAAHLVLDYCDGRDLGKLLDACEGPLPNAVAKALARQALSALAHCHGGGGGGNGGNGGNENGGNSNNGGGGGGVAHRDVKPGNLLLCGRTGLLKLADFGQACVLGGRRKGGKRSRRRSGGGEDDDGGGDDENDDDDDGDGDGDEQQDAPEGALATRWYRPPEVLYGARRYAARAADVWAAGCVLAELYGLQPVLPGRGDLGQLACTVRALGSVDLAAWPEAARLPDWDKVFFEPCRAQGMGGLVPAMPARAAALAQSMLALAPRRRPTAAEALLDPFFAEGDAPASDAAVAAFARETLGRHEARMGRLRLLPVMVAAPLGGRQGARGLAGAGATLTLPRGTDETEDGDDDDERREGV